MNTNNANQNSLQKNNDLQGVSSLESSTLKVIGKVTDREGNENIIYAGNIISKELQELVEYLNEPKTEKP